MVENGYDQWRMGWRGLFGDGESTLQMSLRLHIAVLEIFRLCKPIEADGDRIVISPKQLLGRCQTSLQERFGSVVFAVGQINASEVIDGDCRLRVVIPVCRHVDRNSAF